MIALALALAAPQVMGEAFTFGDENLVAGDPGDAIATFQRVCLQPFPDSAAFTAAIRAVPGFERVDAAETATVGRDGTVGAAVGGVWASRTIAVRYIAAGAVAAYLPQPQCTVSARLATAPDTTALAATISAQLTLGPATQVKAGPYVRSYWDRPRPDGRPWRVLLKAQGDAQGNYMKLSLVRMRPPLPVQR